MWKSFEGQGELRLLLTTTVLPLITLVICGFLFHNTAARLLHPPDVGSEGNEVVDLEQEAEQAVGLVIRRDQFPDMLFAPPKRQTLMDDGVNPVYDKEIHSEIFSQGTLMLRLVIQISMGLAIPDHGGHVVHLSRTWWPGTSATSSSSTCWSAPSFPPAV